VFAPSACESAAVLLVGVGSEIVRAIELWQEQLKPSRADGLPLWRNRWVRNGNRGSIASNVLFDLQ